MKVILSVRLAIGILVLAACSEDSAPMAPASAGSTSVVTPATVGQRTVNSLADPGNGRCDPTECTLREAIAATGSTDIGFAPGLAGTITLAAPSAGGGSIEIDKPLRIIGPTGGITVRRGPTGPEFRLLRIGSHGVVEMTGMAWRNGKTAQPGGGIINFGRLSLMRCLVAGNTSSAHGGGIDSHGPLTLLQTTVSGNEAVGGGGGIDDHDATVTMTDSRVAGNRGGGIHGNAGRIRISGGSVDHNTEQGGISLYWTAATLDGVAVTDNASAGSGGGIEATNGGAVIRNSTVARNSSGNHGGGLAASLGGGFNVVKSTIANNTALGVGGGIAAIAGDPFGRLSSNVTVVNSTITGNVADSGGGLGATERGGGGHFELVNSTIAFNASRRAGGGLAITSDVNADNYNSAFMTNVLVARNTAPTAPDVLGRVGARSSLVGNGRGSNLTNTNGNLVGKVAPRDTQIDPRLGALADNGGPTHTLALLKGSPAVDAASAEECPGKDQRGIKRPQSQGCDIGSFERE